MEKELELYLHIPFCMKKCNYCDFLSAPANEKTQEQYTAALVREIRYYGERCRDRKVSTIYIGGGTPSWLSEHGMEMILKQLFLNFDIKPDAEITIECNPGTLTKKKLQTYRRNMVNRLSMGLQSTMNDELKELGRIHTYEQFVQNYELARKAGFTNINVDLMSALPNQTVSKYLTSLKRVIDLKPEHISAYSLMIEPKTPFYEKYHSDMENRKAGLPTKFLPSEETEYEIYYRAKELLDQAGYCHYEISNYAKPGYECRHNIGYWKRADYLGMGLGASSLLENVRYVNEQELSTYIEGTKTAADLHIQADVISRREQMEEFMFLGLRMTAGVTRAEFRKCFGVEIEAVYGELLPRLSGEGLIACEAGEIRLTDRGRDISNYVLAEFLLE